MLDFEIQRCTRHCSVLGRALLEGEAFYSAIVADGGAVRRVDVAAEAWPGPPDGALGWWKSRMPSRQSHRARLAPSDVLLQVFRELEAQPAAQELRYVLALLLLRRRLLRLEESEREESGREVLVLSCPREESTYRVAAAAPAGDRIDAIQEELARLLFAEPV